jgi:uncharacterized protein (DUF2267 family)
MFWALCCGPYATLPADGAAQLAAQLPLSFRDAFTANAAGRIAEVLSDIRPVNPVSVIEAVFSVIEDHIDAGKSPKCKTHCRAAANIRRRSDQ